ncbi:MAG: hypothetical protein ACRD8O_09555 [Bryobacteraceae bacterium]
MKRLILGTLVTTWMAATWLAGGATGETIAGRQRTQQGRIAQGFRAGQLTPLEAARLERSEAALAREVRRDRIDGGGLTLRERIRIDAQQDRLSNQILRQKHDFQRR